MYGVPNLWIWRCILFIWKQLSTNLVVAQNVMSMGLEGKAEEEAEDAVRDTSTYAVS